MNVTSDEQSMHPPIRPCCSRSGLLRMRVCFPSLQSTPSRHPPKARSSPMGATMPHPQHHYLKRRSNPSLYIQVGLVFIRSSISAPSSLVGVSGSRPPCRMSLSVSSSVADVSRARNERAGPPYGFVKHRLQPPLRQSRALDVLDSADRFPDLVGLLPVDGLHALGLQCVPGGWIFSEIELRADEDDRHIGRVMLNLRIPLVPGQIPACCTQYARAMPNRPSSSRYRTTAG